MRDSRRETALSDEGSLAVILLPQRRKDAKTQRIQIQKNWIDILLCVFASLRLCGFRAASGAVALSLILILPIPLHAHDSPIDHIDRTVQIYIDAGKLHLIYRFRCEERQVMLQLQQMDTNRDGKISEEEREAYFAASANRLTKQLHVEMDGRALQLTSAAPVQLAPDLSQTYHLTAPVGELSGGLHDAKFSDDFSRENPGPYRWSPRQINRNGIEVQAVARPGLEQNPSHPAMIVVNLRISVVSSPTTRPAR